MLPANLTYYPADRADLHAAIITCAGGGYWKYNEQGNEPVARWLNSIGVSAFVLRYALAPLRHPAPLLDLQRAVRAVRASAIELNIDRHRVGVIGFSAGAHLATTAATRFDLGDPASDDPVERESCRPDLTVLSYPVISFDEYAHEKTVVSLLGDEPDPALRASLSNHRQVSPETPPAFLWHAADDETAPVEHSLLYASALSRNKVPFELHIFPAGGHATGLADNDPVLSQWTKLCEVWLNGQGFGLTVTREAVQGRL